MQLQLRLNRLTAVSFDLCARNVHAYENHALFLLGGKKIHIRL